MTAYEMLDELCVFGICCICSEEKDADGNLVVRVEDKEGYGSGTLKFDKDGNCISKPL